MRKPPGARWQSAQKDRCPGRPGHAHALTERFPVLGLGGPTAEGAPILKGWRESGAGGGRLCSEENLSGKSFGHLVLRGWSMRCSPT